MLVAVEHSIRTAPAPRPSARQGGVSIGATPVAAARKTHPVIDAWLMASRDNARKWRSWNCAHRKRNGVLICCSGFGGPVSAKPQGPN